MPDAWEEILPSAHPSVFNFRRARAEHPLNFQRGRDFRGRYLFELRGKFSDPNFPELPRLGGIELTARSTADGDGYLTMVLADGAQIGIFATLCADLLNASSHLSRNESTRGFRIVLERLSKWQELLRRSAQDTLNRSEIIGLTGELLFLRDLISQLGAVHAVQSWRGPFGDEQDFVVGSTIFEIKTQLSTSDQRLNISSEAQLDTNSSPIVLCHQTLGIADGQNASAVSLNSLVGQLRKIVQANSSETVDLFELCLIEAGYFERAEYSERWLLVTRDSYAVENGFPRITAKDLPEGVERVRYSVRVDAIRPFVVDLNQVIASGYASRK